MYFQILKEKMETGGNNEEKLIEDIRKKHVDE